MSKPLKIQVIELTRALIADEEHWCRGHLAVDKSGVAVSAMSPRAVKRCAVGAVIAAAYQLTYDLDSARKLGHESLAPIGSFLFMQVNDAGGHSAVLALFDKVIAAS